MIVFRILLVTLLVGLGAVRLRLILMALASPASLHERDILQEYLMAKAMLAGVNPYLPLDQLAEMFIGKFPYLTHPAPHPPFVAILFAPLTVFTPNHAIIAWFIIELLCLALVSGMLTILWKGKIDWTRTIIFFFLLLSWYPVMVDLLFGQFTLLLTALLLGGLLAWRNDRKVLTGVLVGVTMAIKVFTWPLMIFFALNALRKDWRTFLSSLLTVTGLNLLAALVLGIGTVSDYYLNVTLQANAIYHAFIKNYSIWSIGYRLFEGAGTAGGDVITAPPLLNLPSIAPLVSAGLALVFLAVGLVWAVKSKDKDLAYSIMLCVIVGISPISWDHYYIIISISLVILLLNLSRHAFPPIPTTLFLVCTAIFFFLFEHIGKLIEVLNARAEAFQAGNRITFASSLLAVLPIIALALVTALLWHAGQSKPVASTAKSQ